MSEIERVPIVDGTGAPASHLSVRLSRPEAPRARDLAILYLHGFGSRQDGEKAAFFRRRALADGFTFCSIDFQGHGDSGGGTLALSLTRNVADIGRAHAHLRQRGFRRVVLFGSSMGGASALWYGALHPDGVAGAVHIAPALELEDGLVRLAGAEGLARWQREGRYALEHELGTFELGWGLIEDLRSFDLARLRARYRVPTLIFQGRHDTSVSWRAVVDFAFGCAYDGIELHLIGDGDHRLLPHLDHLWTLAHSFLEARVLGGKPDDDDAS